MISVSRFKALEDGTLFKKASLLISQHIKGAITLERDYLEEIFARIESAYPQDGRIHAAIRARSAREGLLALKDYLDLKSGRADADLDFLSDGRTLDASKRKVRKRHVVLDGIRSPYNLGSAIRSCESFMVKEVILLSASLREDHPNAIRAACRANQAIQCRTFKDRAEGLRYIKSLELPIFSLECGGTDISSFDFPDSAIAIAGNEEFGISRDLLDMSESVISIPLFGCKGSISVSCALAIMLHCWCQKRSHP